MKKILKNLEISGKKIIYYILKLFFSQKSKLINIIPKKIENILFVRIDERIGDVILLEPVIRLLREHYTNINIDLLISEKSVKAANLFSGYNTIHKYNKKWFFKAIWKIFKLFRIINTTKYDIVIDACHWHEPSLSSGIISSLCNGKILIGHEGKNANLFYNIGVSLENYPNYEVTRKMSLLEPLKIKTKNYIPFLNKVDDKNVKNKIDSYFKSSNLKYIGIYPAGRKKANRWNLKEYSKLINYILQNYNNVYFTILWGPNEYEVAEELLNSTIQLLSGSKNFNKIENINNVINIAPETNLIELLEYMRKLNLIVGNDTGPMHIAVATGCNTLTIFTDTDMKRWSHPGKNNYAINVCGLSYNDIASSIENYVSRIL